jgi:hypothetical protein
LFFFQHKGQTSTTLPSTTTTYATSLVSDPQVTSYQFVAAIAGETFSFECPFSSPLYWGLSTNNVSFVTIGK